MAAGPAGRGGWGLSDSHAIRLAEPWQRQLQEGGVRYQRSFHRPSGLTRETVWLVLEDPPAGAGVILNGQPLAQVASEGGRLEIEITGLLATRNCVEVEVAGDAGPPAGQVIGPVKLEIRHPPRNRP